MDYLIAASALPALVAIACLLVASRKKRRRLAYWTKHVESSFKDGDAFCFVQVGSSDESMSVWNGYIRKEDYVDGHVVLRHAYRVVTAHRGVFRFESDYIKNYDIVPALAFIDPTARVVFDTNEFPDKAFQNWLLRTPEGEEADGRLTMML